MERYSKRILRLLTLFMDLFGAMIEIGHYQKDLSQPLHTLLCVVTYPEFCIVRVRLQAIFNGSFWCIRPNGRPNRIGGSERLFPYPTCFDGYAAGLT